MSRGLFVAGDLGYVQLYGFVTGTPFPAGILRRCPALAAVKMPKPTATIMANEGDETSACLQ